MVETTEFLGVIIPDETSNLKFGEITIKIMLQFSPESRRLAAFPYLGIGLTHSLTQGLGILTRTSITFARGASINYVYCGQKFSSIYQTIR